MSNKIRISVANLCPRIKIVETGEEFFFGLLNQKASAKAGKPVYTALGGAVKVTPEGKQALERHLGAELQEGMDARFIVEEQELEKALRLFETRDPSHFELDPMREVREELGDEFPVLSAEDLNSVEVVYTKTLRQRTPESGRGTSAREGTIPSRRVFHLFTIVAPQEVVAKILASDAVRKLSAEEIASTRGGATKGATADGAIIGDNLVW